MTAAAAENHLVSRLNDMALGALTLNLIGVGDDLGLFYTLAPKPLTSAELAAAAKVDARYIKEWCLHMAAQQMLVYDKGSNTFALPAGGKVFTDPKYDKALSTTSSVPGHLSMRKRLTQVYRTGEGIGYGEYPDLVPKGTCRFFKPLYEVHLLNFLSEEIKGRLRAGIAVADVGCGMGVSTRLLAKAFPNSSFVGFDFYAPAIAEATQQKEAEGLANARFAVADAKEFGAEGEFDLVLFLDCFHDMAVADQAAHRSFTVLRPGGLVFLMELLAPDEDSVEAQLALPSCAELTAYSCHGCLPNARGEKGDGCGLGTTCATEKHRELFVGAGFKSLERLPVEEATKMWFRLLVARKS